MIYYRYNWEDGDIEWQYLFDNWDEVVFIRVSDTITVTVKGVGTTVSISKDVATDYLVDASNIHTADIGVNENGNIKVNIGSINIENEGEIENGIRLSVIRINLDDGN